MAKQKQTQAQFTMKTVKAAARKAELDAGLRIPAYRFADRRAVGRKTAARGRSYAGE